MTAVAVPWYSHGSLQVYRREHGRILAGFYFAYFGALGTFGPFVGVYLAARGWSPVEITRLLAVMPVARVLATPAWTYAADRLRSAAAVAQIATLGAVLTFAPAEWVNTRVYLALALVGFTVFRAPVVPLTDSLALAWVERVRGDYGRVRLWGTVGFMLAALVTGTVASTHPRWVVHGTLAGLCLGAVCARALPAAPARWQRGVATALRTLATRPRVMLLLATGVLHQVGMAAYDGLFPLELSRRAGGHWAGVAVALGAGAEVLVMARGGRWIRAMGPARALGVVYGASAVRWLVMAYVVRVPVLVAIQVLHGLSFGGYYMAAVDLLDAEAPVEVRASAQGLHQTVVYGLGTAGALALAARLGAGGDFGRVFLAGAVAAVLAAVLALGFGRAEKHTARDGGREAG